MKKGKKFKKKQETLPLKTDSYKIPTAYGRKYSPRPKSIL